MPKASKLGCDRLAGRFEGLGDNCELGMVQRRCGSEPLGLFRFAGAGLENVIDVLETGGSHLFTLEDIDLFFVESVDEYLLKSKRYDDFQSHTAIFGKSSDEAALKSQRMKTLAFLKQRFFEVACRSEKIFVRKGSESIVDLRRLHAALKRYGPNILLSVAEADAFHKAGTIEKIEEGLFRGYVQQFKRFTKNEPIDLVSWMGILHRTYAACNREYRRERPRRVAKGTLTSFDRGLATEVSRKDLKSPRSLALVLLQDTGHEQNIAVETVILGGDCSVIAVSLRVKIERAFDGRSIDLFVPEAQMLHSQAADLLTRGSWQSVWATAKIQKGGGAFTVVVRIGARKGSEVSLGEWVIDTGPIPLPARWTPARGDLRRLVMTSIPLRSRHAKWPRLTRDADEVLKRSSRAMAKAAYIDADDMLATALADAPGDPALLKQYAFSAHNSGRYVTALMRWQKALASAPHDPMCHAGVASNFREYGEIGIAADLIGVALARFPDDGIILTEAARIANARMRYDEAADLWDKAISRYGPHPQWVDALAKARADGAHPIERHERQLAP